MLSKNQIKRIQSLARKKGRREEGCFIAEGNKLVEDTLSVFECDLILATPSWIVSHAHESLSKIQEVDEQEMSKVSQLVTPPDVLAVYRIPEYHLNIETLKKELVLALDTVQDPGNLGTIVRLADWFGIRHIVCSPDTADLYNPKVVQATMGALARVKVYYRSLPDFLSQVDSSVVYGTFLDGEDIYHTSLTKSGVIAAESFHLTMAGTPSGSVFPETVNDLPSGMVILLLRRESKAVAEALTALPLMTTSPLMVSPKQSAVFFTLSAELPVCLSPASMVKVLPVMVTEPMPPSPTFMGRVEVTWQRATVRFVPDAFFHQMGFAQLVLPMLL